MGPLASFSARAFFIFATVCAAQAQTAITAGTPVAEYPSYNTLGIQLPISGDANFNAAVSVRYRQTGTPAWKDALPLFRPRPATVAGLTVAPHFAGSIFDLRPATSYEVELTVADADGGGTTKSLTTSTAALPKGPASPRIVNVATSAQFQAALDAAQPGDVITLADGVYTGLVANEFRLDNSGNAANPIVIRGVNAGRAILDAQSCTGCIALMIFSTGNVQVENLTIRNAQRGIRFFGQGSSNFLIRRIRTVGVESPVWSTHVGSGVAVVDCVFQGSLVWPQNYVENPGFIREGVSLSGNGHIVAHNRFIGFSDSVNFRTWGHRGHDIYGNDFYDVYDNAVELDGGAGNLRVYRNRVTDAFMPMSVQPTLGGPADIFRNEMYAVASEPFKFHALLTPATAETSGNLVYHNTSVNSDYAALGVETPYTTHNFEIKNNLLFGAPGQYSLTWLTPVNFGIFDYNAYSPDGGFRYREANNTPRYYLNLAAMKAANDPMERNGRIVNGATTFARGATSLNDYTVRHSPQSLALAAGSGAIDAGLVLPNINSDFAGAAPDAGAREFGCGAPWYGPRPVGMDESNQRRGCEAAAPAVGTATFVRMDATTKGDWPSKYGSAGFAVAGGDSNLGAAFSTNGATEVWQTPTSLLKAPRRSRTTAVRSAAGWVNDQDLYLNLNVDGTKNVDLYLFEINNTSTRRVFIEVYDANYNLLDTRLVDDFASGRHLIWRASGRIRFRVVLHKGQSNAVASAVLVDPA